MRSRRMRGSPFSYVGGYKRESDRPENLALDFKSTVLARHSTDDADRLRIAVSRPSCLGGLGDHEPASPPGWWCPR